MEFVGVVGALVVGVAGFVVAVLAHHRAGQANEEAKAANEIASKAVEIAKESNRIAQDANEISRDAKQIVATQAAQEVEQWLVDWAIQWDAKRGAVSLRHTGRDTAHQLTVIVRGDEFYEICGDGADVAGGENAVLPLTKIGEIRAAYDREPFVSMMAGDFVLYEDFRKEVEVTVHWFTGLGQPQEKMLNLVLK